MLKDLTLSHFWILMNMGFNMPRIWDVNFIDEDTLMLDYKDYVPKPKAGGGKLLFDYTRYKIFIPNRKILKQLTIREKDDFDYENYFSNNDLGIIQK